MKEPKHDDKEELPSAVDDAASVTLESKRNEAFVKKNALEKKDSSVSRQKFFFAVILLLVALSAIVTYSL